MRALRQWRSKLVTFLVADAPPTSNNRLPLRMRKFVRDDLGLGRKERGMMGGIHRVRVAGIEGVGRRIECVRRGKHDGLGGERAAGDLADGLLQQRIVDRDLARCVVEGPLAATAPARWRRAARRARCRH